VNIDIRFYLDTLFNILLPPNKYESIYHRKKKNRSILEKLTEMYLIWRVPFLRKFNAQMANIILGNMKDYSFLHSSSVIVNAVTSAIKGEVPTVSEYIQHRMIKS
jgi:hypothetical protein